MLSSRQYERISQKGDSDEETTLFSRDGEETEKTAKIEERNGRTYKQMHTIEPPSRKPVVVYYSRTQALLSVSLFLTVLGFMLIIGVLVIFYGSQYRQQKAGNETLPHTTLTQAISWEREFYPSTTECTIELYDMNGDGMLDVVTVDALRECVTKIVAMDGRNGDIVLEKVVDFEAFAVVCEADLNLDGVTDCLAAGRSSGFIALNGINNSSTLWVVDQNIVFPRYNFYFPLIVGDLNGDGVRDIINVHGGDSHYRVDEIERSPAFLVAISGRTGQKLMPPILTPDGRESYMSPVLFSFPDEAEVILFGTGGETIPGSLWGVTLNSIRERVQHYIQTSPEYASYEISTVFVNHPCKGDMTNPEIEALRPVFDHTAFDLSESVSDVPPFSSCPLWGELKPLWNRYNVCLYELLRTEEKGVVLPPIIIEMTGDGQEDLIVSTYDGHTIVLDGRNGRVVWDKHFPGSESYSIPSPFYFNHDNIPDLLVQANKGIFQHYKYSTLAILDGQNGEVLWSLNSSQATMMSGVSLLSRSHKQDSVIFIASGTNGVRGESGQVDSRQGRRESKDRRSLDAAALRTEMGLRHCHPYFDGSSMGVCPSYEWGDGPRGVYIREKRHGGEGEEEEEGVSGEGEAQEDGKEEGKGHDYIDYSQDFIEQIMNATDLPGVWDSTEEDQFPDPRTHLDEFLLYCGYSREQLTAHLFFLTPELASTHTLRPLTSHEPYVYFLKPAHTSKRHGGSHDNDDDDDLANVTKKYYRCRHIAVTRFISATPAIGDLDGDGRLEVAYVVNWAGLDITVQLVPPKFMVKVFTLEAKVGEVYGEGVVDFSRFLPMEQQPWTHYMGARGDNVFRVRG